jgi:putative oxidoreductase
VNSLPFGAVPVKSVTMQMHWLINPTAPAASIVIRIMIGAVFLSEGIQKFLLPEEVGAGRFTRIGIPNPEFMAPFVGAFEIGCGILVLLGLVTRIAVVPLLIIMAVAVFSTKIPILMDEGFWKMAHASRNDYSMIMGSIYLLWMGPGPWSLDWKWFRPATR